MVNPQLPATLYKFLPARRCIDGPISFLGSGRLLRFTQSGSFNDPFECLTSWDVAKADRGFIEKHLVGKTMFAASMPYVKRRRFEARKRHFAKERIRRHPVQMAREFAILGREVVDQSVGALSLSKSWAISPMWAHYGGNHAGVGIGFRADHFFFRHRPNNLVIEVRYSQDRPKIDPSKFDNIDYMSSMIFGVKDARWSYEEEVRIVKALKDASKTLAKDSRGNRIHLFEIPASAVSEVIVGLNVIDQDLNEIRALCSGLSGVRLFRAKIGLDSYDLEREEISI